MRYKRILAVVFPFFMFATVASATPHVQFVVDFSGSMRQKLGNQTQLAVAKEALLRAVQGIPEGVLVAVRVYAHRFDQSDKPNSCKDTELLVPFGPPDSAALSARLQGLEAKGYTPIAYSLEQVKSDFPPEAEGNRVVILLSDGEETCGGDPVSVVKKLIESGFAVTVHTIGFNVDAKTRAQLEAIAKAGSGDYFDAKNSDALFSAISEATQKAAVIDKKLSVYGSEVRGGDSFETAVSIEPGKEYRLDHHQKKDAFDYFGIALTAGQEITVELRTYEKGINILPNGTVKETDHPYAGMRLLSTERAQVGKKEIIGRKAGLEALSFVVPATGTYYLLIGSEYSSMHKDFTSFKYSVSSKGDLDTAGDASEKSSEAMPIEPKRYGKNHIGGADKRDTFRFVAKKGDVVTVGLIPEDDFTSGFSIRVMDEYRQEIFKGSGKLNSGYKSDAFTIPSDGSYTLSIELTFDRKETFEYILDFALTSAAPGT